MSEPSFDPNTPPNPGGGWSEQITYLRDAVAVPASKGAFIQPAGILGNDGQYRPEGALWRKFRCLTTRPETPPHVHERLPGRWLWGGALSSDLELFLLEGTARLWALEHLGEPVRGVLYIPKRPRTGSHTTGYQQDTVNLFAPGLEIRVATSPVQVEELVVPGQGFGHGDIIRGTGKFRAAIQNRFARDISPDGPDKLYVQAPRADRRYLGEEHLEDLLSLQGYQSFRPDTRDVTTQIARYKAAAEIVVAESTAVHLMAMVSRPDQRVAILKSHKSRKIGSKYAHLRHFGGLKPINIDPIGREWFRSGLPTAQTIGEIDHNKVGSVLSEEGFIPPDTNWPGLTDAERKEAFDAYPGREAGEFVETPLSIRRRIRLLRRRRRAKRAALQTLRED